MGGPWVGWWWGRRRSRWPRRGPAARPPGENRAEPEWCLRPSLPRCHARIDVRLADRGQGQHPGGHRAEHHRAPGDPRRPAARAVERGPDQRHRSPRRGTQVAAYRPVPSSSGPGRRHSPSPGSRPVPQAKHVGNGWSARPSKRASAARACSSVTAGGTSSTRSADAVAARHEVAAVEQPHQRGRRRPTSAFERERAVERRRAGQPHGDGRPWARSWARGRRRCRRPSRRCRTRGARSSGGGW